MRVLLDECVHFNLSRFLSEHNVLTVTQAGWRGIKNGSLLRLASEQFDIFITSDKNLQYQQHEASLPIPVVTIATKGNMWADIEPIVPKLTELLKQQLNNKFYRIGEQQS